ncbi:MAG: glycosyltransferase family 4 protein [Candidatus Bathyarchaeia archaeon]|jgi:glycosyltransferase involved in cell wall biosynthesis
MKINFTMTEVERTGGVRVLFEIANRLSERGHDVTIVTLGKSGSHSWFPLKSKIIFAENERSLVKGKSNSSLLKNVLSVMPNNIASKLKSGAPYNTLRAHAIKVLTEHIPQDIDINIATFCFSAFSVNDSGAGIPFYYMQHYEPIFFDDNYTKKLIDKTYLLPLNRIANSTWLRVLLRERLCVDSYGPVIPGVEHEVFYPRAVRKNGSEKLILALGKSQQWKGLWDLFEALKVSKKDIPNIKLILYGSEPNMKELSPVPCDYLTRINDTRLAELYSMADVVVTPSWYESSPLPPLEAMACGAPVVTTRYGTEDYCFNDINCLVVPPKNPKMLSDAILRLLRDSALSEQFRKEGQRTAKQFTWENATNKVEQLFAEILSKS